MLVIGANKPATIAQHPILEWNRNEFGRYLSHAETRLMVIGYSFRDEHVNKMITEAARDGALDVFLIGPQGVEPIVTQSPTLSILFPRVIGASQRGLREIFGGDRAEHAKVMRFFS